MTLKETVYLVNLGGKAKNSHVELHDIRWVGGRRIEETFDQLRKEWFGTIKGLHIDSYIEINFIDGYRVNLIAEEQFISQSITYEENKLWFINLGGYSPKDFNERHCCVLVVSKTASEAKFKAKSKWLNNLEGKHLDNLYNIMSIKDVRDDYIDDCIEINKIGKWNVFLSKDINNRSQEIIPDWYGYMRLDK